MRTIWAVIGVVVSVVSTSHRLSAQTSIDAGKLNGTWELVSTKNVNTSEVDSVAKHRRSMLQYSNGHIFALYNELNRPVISTAEMQKYGPEEKTKAVYNRFWNDKGPIFGGNVSRYKVDGAKITYTRLISGDPYNVGRDFTETILRLDDSRLVVRLAPNAAGVVIEETYRRVD